MKKLLLTSCIVITTFLNAQTFEWAKTLGGGSFDRCKAIATDPSGNIYVTGSFRNTVDLDPGPGTDNHTSTGGDDLYIQKLDASGNFIWAKSFGGTDFDVSISVATDPSGNILVLGRFKNAVDFNPGAGTDIHTSSGDYDIFVQKLDASGNFIWAKTFGGNDVDICYEIKTDAQGNIYTTGAYKNTVDFDPGAGTDNHTSAGNYDVFVQKLTPSGNFVWAKTFGELSDDQGFSIDVDAAGNIYTIGTFKNTVDFDPSSGTDNHTSAGDADIFIQKLNASGNYIWTKTFGGTSYEIGTSIATDKLGNIYITGRFQNTADFDPGPGTDNYTSAGNFDVFIQKLNNSGGYVWTKTFGGNEYETSSFIDVDTLGNTYITGYFKNTVDFDPGSGTDNHTAVANFDIYLQKLDASGNFIWAKTFGGINNEEGLAVHIDAFDNIYTVGIFGGTVDFDPGAGTDNHTSSGNFDGFIQKLSNCTVDNTTSLSGTTITANATGTNYQWIDCDNNNQNITGETSQSFTATSNGNYACIIDNGSCADTTDCININTVGLTENKLDFVKIYPNPTDGQLFIQSDQHIQSILIQDIFGQILHQTTKTYIDVRDLPSGMFLISIKTDQGTITKRFVKK